MICLYPAGRLGHSIGDYAFALALRDRLKVPLYFPRIEQFEMFSIPWTVRMRNAANGALWHINRHLNPPLRIDHFEPFADYNLGNAVDNAYYCGYWSPMPYLGALEKRLRKQFRVNKKHVENFRRRTTHIPLNRLMVVGVRGGDYKGLAALGGNYYANALSRLRENAGMYYTMVVTDDQEYAKQVLPDWLRVDEVLILQPEFAFQVIMSAKIAVIANSTFHFWAAWLGRVQRVLAPTYFIGVPDLKWIPPDMPNYVPWEWV